MTYEIRKITSDDLNQILEDAKSDPHCDSELFRNLDFLIKDREYAIKFINSWVIDLEKKSYLFRTCSIARRVRPGETYNAFTQGRMFEVNTASVFESKIYFTKELTPDPITLENTKNDILNLFTALNPAELDITQFPITLINDPENNL